MIQYDSDHIRQYYDQYAEKEWARWDRSPVEQVKLEIHLHYLRQYVEPASRVLEIGAGSGRFTQELARITDRIIVADISPVQLQLNRENAHTLGFSDAVESWEECDICDLRPHFAGEEFDAVVCYGGPLSYVFEQRDQAMSELLRVTKAGGVLLLGVMSLWGTVHQYLPDVLEVDTTMNKGIIAGGDLGPDQGAHDGHHLHMFRAGEFRELLEAAGATIETLSASNCLSATWPESLEAIREDANAWQSLIEMELEACREPGCLDMGTHLIAVCRKPQSLAKQERSQ